MTSITEKVNELSVDLDKVNSLGILRLLRQCDSQIFSGYLDYQSIVDKEIEEEVILLVERIVEQLNQGFSINVVSTGAGTSGRLAFFISRSFNKILKEKGYENQVKFNYLIAGGDLCLTVGMEGAEDNIHQAVNDIKSQLNQENDKEIIVYIGITCGFSAPYVAAQLDFLLNENTKENAKKQHIISLMGFNPIELARKLKIEKWEYSFNDIVERLNKLKHQQESKSRNYFILNPIFGPEPLTGSTRMKSGSGTKILIELIFSLVLNHWKSNEFKLQLNGDHQQHSLKSKYYLILKNYEQTCRETYYNIEPLSKVIESVGNSLKKRSHLYYLAPESLGIVGFIDASETLPTFGARPLDVCGFLMNSSGEEGWSVMNNREGDLSSVSDQYKISQKDFTNRVLPNTTQDDTIVISIGSIQQLNQFKSEIVPSLIQHIKPNQSVNLIYFKQDNNDDKILDKEITELSNSNFTSNINFIKIQLSNSEIISGLPCFYEISLKWILNSLTTGGFVLAGKVYGNRMIDLGLTNNKLFYRSCGIINSIMKLNDEELARKYLICSVYSINSINDIPQEILELPVYRHIEYCEESKIKSIVPVALLLASGKFSSPSLIRDEICKQPIIRLLLDQHKPK
ncbi:hypothetical protein DICPUDRAFT_94700 [Dictyostelium purpureum]|uniref:SIS domain-containing protein n=1 Tax=Dictyostelium purpureum TaxID=5786 RepID=F0ZML1_DICPU|nr:uncharacterized protein DICPUDRAFT_94700 [Dictyostelium purpureum]EGC34796.1 hypothetical protein DICPUDRAFT_94700 [Dictyostelium purpureum]|eukprot:XP_003288653.1 hypothetical protein DICPUDRAFT_94700 [Dictyostelium purpureum]